MPTADGIVVFGIGEVEGVADADDVRGVLVLVSVVVRCLVVLKPWDIDLFDARVLLAIEETSSLVLQGVLPSSPLPMRVHHEVVAQVSQFFHLES